MSLRLAPGKETWTTRSRVVGVRKRFMQVRALPIEPPVRPLDWRAVRKLPERPRPLAHRVVLGDFDLAGIPGDEVMHGGTRGSVLRCHDAVGSAVEAREMVEAERFAVHFEASAEVAAHPPRGEIPCRNVVTRALEDRDSVEEHRREVDPFLVGEKTVGNLGAAKVLRALRPPIGKAVAFRGVADTNETEIEDAVLQARDLVVDDRFETF